MAAFTDAHRQQTLPAEPHQAHFQQRQQPQRFYQPPPQRPHRSNSKSRTFSFHSQKSHKSSGSKDLHESPAEKDAKRLHSKADPTLAISEAEPSAVAAFQVQTMTPLRSVQHKDVFGNEINDPDKSNPTRSRWERPLDTIRSFEAAIDGGYNRMSVHRSESESIANWNRRTSYQPSLSPRSPTEPSYSNRPVSIRREQTYHEMGPPRQSYFDGQAYSNGYGAGPSRMRTSRVQTDSQYPPFGRDRNIYPMPHKDRSYETVTSAAGSGNSDQAGYQTDPTSSDNSSIERPSPGKRPELVNDYGMGSNQPQSHQAQNLPNGLGLSGNGKQPYQQSYQPQNPSQKPALAPQASQRQKHTLTRRQSTQQVQATLQAPEPEKRKSWLARRFSRRGKAN